MTCTFPCGTAGARDAPPQDCGGVPGYEHLIQVLADPEHPEHADLAEWAPDGFDPEAFSVQAIDTALARLH